MSSAEDKKRKESPAKSPGPKKKQKVDPKAKKVQVKISQLKENEYIKTKENQIRKFVGFEAQKVLLHQKCVVPYMLCSFKTCF